MKRPISVLLGIALSGCVVTTYEAPGDPPRIVSAPEPAHAANREPSLEATQHADAGNPADTISASHILVQYRGALRAGPTIVRSKSEALARAKEALARAKKGEDFKVLAGEYSDEPGAGERGGSLGQFRRDSVVKEFSRAAFALKPGELSDVVESPFGYHVILRNE